MQGTIPSLSAMVFSCPGGAFFWWLKDVASSCSSRSRSSAAATTKIAAEQLTAGAGQQEGHVDKLPRAGNILTRVSEGTLGLVDYHCRAPFRPSVPWCFPVREVRFFKAICWLKDVASSCSSRSRSSAAATTKVAAEQLTAGAGQQEGHVDKLPRAAKSWKFVFFN